jgi:hypothetical protein
VNEFVIPVENVLVIGEVVSHNRGSQQMERKNPFYILPSSDLIIGSDLMEIIRAMFR